MIVFKEVSNDHVNVFLGNENKRAIGSWISWISSMNELVNDAKPEIRITWNLLSNFMANKSIYESKTNESETYVATFQTIHGWCLFDLNVVFIK